MFKNFFFHVLWNKSWLHLFRDFNILQNIFDKKTQPSFACIFLGGPHLWDKDGSFCYRNKADATVCVIKTETLSQVV